MFKADNGKAIVLNEMNYFCENDVGENLMIGTLNFKLKAGKCYERK